MHHLETLNGLKLQGAWCTIGSFDGVHRGHQAIISSLVHAAHAAGAPAVVVTFHPHPAVLLRGITTPFYITSPQERADLLAQLGVDYVITLPFDRAMASLGADEFMRMLADHLGLAWLWVGHDFALGRGRSGDISALQAIGQQLGYQLQVIGPVQDGSEVISSSQIRSLLLSGNVEAAAGLLGRPYFVQGNVISGQQRGRRIGIPTANLDLPGERLLPANGVYATRALINGQPWASVTNIGLRPTFENAPVLPRVEAHLMDFTGDLYNHEIKLEFIAHLRPEQTFPNVQELIAQIQKDIRQAREVLDA